MNISFEKASVNHIEIILSWLSEPHIIEFWDNSLDHREDILNFIHGNKRQYFFGTAQYWIGSKDGEPYSFIVTDLLQFDLHLSQVHKKHTSKEGHTITLDFGIGNKKFLGQGLASPTLTKFCSFYKGTHDPLADTFFIDPGASNPKARHVYSKAGFLEVGLLEDTHQEGFKEEKIYLMVRKL